MKLVRDSWTGVFGFWSSVFGLWSLVVDLYVFDRMIETAKAEEQSPKTEDPRPNASLIGVQVSDLRHGLQTQYSRLILRRTSHRLFRRPGGNGRRNSLPRECSPRTQRPARAHAESCSSLRNV